MRRREYEEIVKEFERLHFHYKRTLEEIYKLGQALDTMRKKYNNKQYDRRF